MNRHFPALSLALTFGPRGCLQAQLQCCIVGKYLTASTVYVLFLVPHVFPIVVPNQQQVGGGLGV